MADKNDVGFKVLASISVLTKKLAKSELKIRRTQEFTKAEEQLGKYFGTSSRSTWMLCGIISYYFDNHGCACNFNNLSSFFGCTVMSVIAYKEDIEDLLAKGYIRNDEAVDETTIELKNEFALSTELLECILHNRKISISKKKDDRNSVTNLVKKIGRVIETSSVASEIKNAMIASLEEHYAENAFLSQTMRIIPGSSESNRFDRMFFYDSCSDFLKGNDTCLSCTIEDVYGDEDETKFRIANSFLDESHILLKTDLLEFVNKGCLTDSQLTLTQKAKELLLGDDAWLFMKSAKGTDVIQPEDITPIKLFYSAENELEIGRLKASLNEEKLRDIQERLAAKGLSKGIAVLLYGAPGTGKTETVYQLARETHRAILHVDISSAKSCWFGESEKIVKRIFTDYKQMCRSSRGNKDGIMPILLFNEADGILSKRKDVTNGNLSQTENTIQNIILEEIEKLEGIMICTTNLANNLDVAFERRFLFKIKFEYPTLDAKKRIWKSKLGWLDDTAALAVAKDYDLSGGQIDNIVRKITMDEVLTGKLPDMDELFTMCRNEKLGGTEHKIGFF